MSLIHFAIKHGQSLDYAKQQLQDAIGQMNPQFAAVIEKVTWSDDKQQVVITGKGFDITARVDAESVLFDGNLPWLAKLLGGPLVEGLRRTIEEKFQPKIGR